MNSFKTMEEHKCKYEGVMWHLIGRTRDLKWICDAFCSCDQKYEKVYNLEGQLIAKIPHHISSPDSDIWVLFHKKKKGWIYKHIARLAGKHATDDMEVYETSTPILPYTSSQSIRFGN